MLTLNRLNQKGQMNILTIPLILAALLLVGASVLSVVFYMQYVDQRDNNQPKIEAAVEKAKEEQASELEAAFLEREKSPYDTYTAPAELGSVKLTYSKKWSAYVDLKSGRDMEMYVHPNYVPSKDVNYALRMSVVSRQFASELKSYDSLVRRGELKATSIEVAGTKGVRLDGFLESDVEGSLVAFPLRDKTLRVWTESKDFRGDFNNIVLKKLTFVP